MPAVSRRVKPECERVMGHMRSLQLERQLDLVLVHDAVGIQPKALAKGMTPRKQTFISPDVSMKMAPPCTTAAGNTPYFAPAMPPMTPARRSTSFVRKLLYTYPRKSSSSSKLPRSANTSSVPEQDERENVEHDPGVPPGPRQDEHQGDENEPRRGPLYVVEQMLHPASSRPRRPWRASRRGRR